MAEGFDSLNTVPMAAQKLGGVSTKTVEQWMRQGRLRKTKLGRRVFLRSSELQRFIDAGSQDVGAPGIGGGEREGNGGQLRPRRIIERAESTADTGI
jgi:excisionase family DNA binding protein